MGTLEQSEENGEKNIGEMKKEVAPVDKQSTFQNPLGGLRTHLSQSGTDKGHFLLRSQTVYFIYLFTIFKQACPVQHGWFKWRPVKNSIIQIN